MKRLGTVIHIIDTLLIVRADKTLGNDVLPQNQTVITKKMKKIGNVKELFGPVTSPCFSIKPFKGIPESEINKLKHERVYLQ